MEEYFGDISDLWMAADSGYLYKMGSKHGWKKLISLSNKVWFSSVREIMNIYTENVDGSTVEERESTLVWNFKNSDEEQGAMTVKELYNHIKMILGNCPVEII